MRVTSLKSNLQYVYMKKQSSHWPSNSIFHSTPWPLWTLPWPRYHQHLHKNCGGQDGDSKCKGCWSQPRNCSKKTIRLPDGALCCASFLDVRLKDEIEIPTSWRSTVPLLSFFWEKAFPTPRVLYQPPNLQDWLKINILPPGGLRQIWSGVKSQRVNFQTKLWCLLVV